jgi:hypothetical protein
VVGDQNLGSVGTEDFDVVALLEDGTSVGEFGVGTFNSCVSLSVQDDLVLGEDLYYINTVGGNSGTNDTSPGSSGGGTLESVVNSEGFIFSSGHVEVTFLVEIEVSTTSETGDVGIVPDGASLLLNGRVVGGSLLAVTTNGPTVALESKHESRFALQGSLNLDYGGSAVASLNELLGNADGLLLDAVSLLGEAEASSDGGSDNTETASYANLLGSALAAPSLPLLADWLLDCLDALGPLGAMLHSLGSETLSGNLHAPLGVLAEEGDRFKAFA